MGTTSCNSNNTIWVMNYVLLNLTHMMIKCCHNAAFLGIAATNQLRDTVVTNHLKWDDQVNGMESAGTP